jgi:hypothetical protein
MHLVEQKLTKNDTGLFRTEASDCVGHLLHPLIRTLLHNIYLHDSVPREIEVAENHSAWFRVITVAQQTFHVTPI